jgi:hypothetical protein
MNEDMHDRAGVYLIARPQFFGVDGPTHAWASLVHGHVVPSLSQVTGADEGIVARTDNSYPFFTGHAILSLQLKVTWFLA